MEKEEEKEDLSLPPSPYAPIGSDVDERHPVQGQEGREGPQFFAAFAATLGNLVMGTTIGWSSPAGPLLAMAEQDGGFHLSDD